MNQTVDPCVLTIGPMLDEHPAIHRPQYYYPAPLWRRLVLILVGGLIAAPVTVVVAWRLLLGIQPDVTGLVLFAGIGSAGLPLLLRARFRLDADGIARRGWLGWRTTPWSEILARPAPTLCVGQGLWTGASARIRRLYRALMWLEAKDALALSQMLTPPGARTHLPQMPGRFRLQTFGPAWLEIDREGLRIEDDTRIRSWYWNDVRQVKIRKETDTSCRVDGMWIELSDGTRFSSTGPTIECESPCECRHDYLLQQFLRGMLPAEKVLVWAKVGEPASIAEARYRRESKASDVRLGRILMLCYGVAVATLLWFGLFAGNRGCLRNAIQLIAYSVFFGPGVWGVTQQQCRERDRLQSYLDARGAAE